MDRQLKQSLSVLVALSFALIVRYYDASIVYRNSVALFFRAPIRKKTLNVQFASPVTVHKDWKCWNHNFWNEFTMFFSTRLTKYWTLVAEKQKENSCTLAHKKYSNKAHNFKIDSTFICRDTNFVI